MSSERNGQDSTYLFERMPVPRALLRMAIPTIASQLITLIYNIADTWFIGRTNNPYMVAAASLVLTVYMLCVAISNLFGVGGGTLAVRRMGTGDREEARKVSSLSFVMALGASLAFSLLCLVFSGPLLRFIGASDNTFGYAREYLLVVVVIGGPFAVMSQVMSNFVRNVGYSREAGFGLGMGGVLNVVLDPLFMFVILPDGRQVLGAAIATMLSNLVTLVYFFMIYGKLRGEGILEVPRRIEMIPGRSMRELFAVGIPAAAGILLFDVNNMVLLRLMSGYGDAALAAVGIVLKAERLPLNVGIGICLGMTPLVAYNFASGDRERMLDFFRTARMAGLIFALFSVVLYRFNAARIIRIFIGDPETVRLGTLFLQRRCYATPFMFLSFQMNHYMQGLGCGRESFLMTIIRQLCLNMPLLLILNAFFGSMGIVTAQMTADIFNVIASYVIYAGVKRRLSIS